MESDGKFNKNFVVNRIKEYNIEYLNSYVNENCLDGDVSSFLVNEIDFIENKIKENKNYGFGMQLFQHQKKIIYDYCRLNKIDLHNGFTPPQKKSKPINTPKILNESFEAFYFNTKYMNEEQNIIEPQQHAFLQDAVSRSHYVNIFFTWFLFLDEEEVMQTCLEVSFRQSNGTPITYKFNGLKRIRSDNWVKKFVKTEISDLLNAKLKANRKQCDYYVPTIIYAMMDDFR